MSFCCFKSIVFVTILKLDNKQNIIKNGRFKSRKMIKIFQNINSFKVESWKMKIENWKLKIENCNFVCFFWIYFIFYVSMFIRILFFSVLFTQNGSKLKNSKFKQVTKHKKWNIFNKKQTKFHFSIFNFQHSIFIFQLSTFSEFMYYHF